MVAQRVIITDTAGGIGLATARIFTKSGAQVLGLDIASFPEDVTGIAVDIAAAQSVDKVVGEACLRLGDLDCLVNCAGVEYDAALADLDTAALDKMLAIICAARCWCARGGVAVLRGERLHHQPCSELAYLGRANASGYCASKGGILSLTRSWAREIGPRIRANAVALGPIDTALLNFKGMSEQLKKIETGNPMGRIGMPQAVAAVIRFLASAEASFITGQCYGVDGGAGMH